MSANGRESGKKLPGAFGTARNASTGFYVKDMDMPPRSEAGAEDPLVSVVIPAPADLERAPRCVEEVLAQSWTRREVVLVCDPQAEVSIPRNTDVRVVREERHRNLACLINRGLKEARGDIRVLLMPNCLPASNAWLEELVRAFDDPEVGAVVSQCVAHDTRELNLPARLMESVESPELTADGRPRELHLLSHLCDAFRAEVLGRLGHLYDETLPSPGEAVDISLRIAPTGKKIVLAPAATVWYLDPPQTRSLGTVMASALDYGRADAALGKAYNIDWLGSRTFAAAALSLLIIPAGLINLPLGIILTGLLFAWGWFLPLRVPLLRWEWPLAVFNVAVYAGIVLSIREHWAPALFPPRQWHPAIIRQWCLLGAMTCSYLLILLRGGTASAVRAVKDLRGLASFPAVLVLSMAWQLLSGVGYIAGYLTASAPGESETE